MAFKKGMTAYNFDDLTGKTFNRLTVIKRVYRNNSKKVYWKYVRCIILNMELCTIGFVI